MNQRQVAKTIFMITERTLTAYLLIFVAVKLYNTRKNGINFKV